MTHAYTITLDITQKDIDDARSEILGGEAGGIASRCPVARAMLRHEVFGCALSVAAEFAPASAPVVGIRPHTVRFTTAGEVHHYTSDEMRRFVDRFDHNYRDHPERIQPCTFAIYACDDDGDILPNEGFLS
jgi:hypothetical protein